MIRLIVLQKERETEIESAMQIITIYGNRKVLCCVYLVFCTSYNTTNYPAGYRYILYITVSNKYSNILKIVLDKAKTNSYYLIIQNSKVDLN